jgi:hypothetical protein
MKNSTLLLALLTGTCAGALSLLMLHYPDRFEPSIVLLFPGFILAMPASGNVHAFSMSVVAIGNFGFYFGSAYLARGAWKWRASPAKGPLPTSESGSVFREVALGGRRRTMAHIESNTARQVAIECAAF